ncbi:MAG: hypothetical protein AVDCRST_MAG93-1446, partial [uncultured Chloroflexia bacterium]
CGSVTTSMPTGRRSGQSSGKSSSPGRRMPTIPACCPSRPA